MREQLLVENLKIYSLKSKKISIDLDFSWEQKTKENIQWLWENVYESENCDYIMWCHKIGNVVSGVSWFDKHTLCLFKSIDPKLEEN